MFGLKSRIEGQSRQGKLKVNLGSKHKLENGSQSARDFKKQAGKQEQQLGHYGYRSMLKAPSKE